MHTDQTSMPVVCVYQGCPSLPSAVMAPSVYKPSWYDDIHLLRGQLLLYWNQYVCCVAGLLICSRVFYDGWIVGVFLPAAKNSSDPATNVVLELTLWWHCSRP